MDQIKKAWWITLFLKLALSALIPLSADEAYYWVWSKFPQLSYFDHPPFVSWLFWIGSLLPDTLVRWPSVLIFHLSFLLWFEVLKGRLDRNQILNWFILCLLCPLTGLGSIFVLPDAPLFAFFSLSLFCFHKALETSKSIWYLGFGASLGLAFLSKYIIVIAALLFVIHLIVSRSTRHLSPWRVALVVASGLVFCLPVLMWNFQNDFRSFRFQFNHGLAEGHWKPEWTLSYLLGTLFLISPVIVPYVLRRPMISGLGLFQVLAWSGLGFFVLTSFKGSVELNWPSIFYPCAFVLAAAWIGLRQMRWNLFYWFVIYLVVMVVSLSGWVPVLKEKLSEPYRVSQWKDLPLKYDPLYASTYQLASLMWWNSKKPVYKLKDSSRYDFFDERPESQPEGDFYFLKEMGNNVPDWAQSSDWTIQEVQILDEKHMVLKISRRGPQ